jgi:hypothetical protein
MKQTVILSILLVVGRMAGAQEHVLKQLEDSPRHME